VEDRSTESSASLTECHPRKFFLQSFSLGGVRRLSQSIHEQKESLLLGVFRLQTRLEQIDEHAIGAGLSRLPPTRARALRYGKAAVRILPREVTAVNRRIREKK